VRELCTPGVVVHGVALKPGKPVCLAVHDGKPVFILPGFPTSAVFTFHEFAAPVIRRLAGLPAENRGTITARLPMRLNAQRGRIEYALVSLIDSAAGLVAWPLGAGSGSVTTFSLADGFLRIDQQTEFVDADTEVSVTLLSDHIRPADLVFVGSHCNRLEGILSALRQQGFHCKTIFGGSHAGLAAAHNDQCDVAGIHLVDPDTGEFNRPFLKEGVELLKGYPRMQGIVCRPDDERFEHSDARQLLVAILQVPDCRMINRNSGSGTRMLIDRLLNGSKPAGYSVQPGSHNAVCAAVESGRADWGVAIQPVASNYNVSFTPVAVEQYDFVVPSGRLNRPAVAAFRRLLNHER
jgi:molybdopterin molybdotransferase/putative molybdopterin biosynthesis protein